MFWIRRKAVIGKLTKWFPFALTVGTPADTQEVGEEIAKSRGYAPPVPLMSMPCCGRCPK